MSNFSSNLSSFKHSDDDTLDFEEQDGGAKKRAGSKKSASKSGSKKSGSKTLNRSKSVAKPMKAGSKKSGSKIKRGLPPALVESQKTNKYISAKLGYNISPALISYVTNFRKSAKAVKGVDEKDYVTVNKKIIEFFDEALKKSGKEKLVSDVEKVADRLRSEREKKKSQKK